MNWGAVANICVDSTRGLGSASWSGAGTREAAMQQEAPRLRFATQRLASGPQIHYGEQGDPGGAPVVFLPGYTDS